MWPLWHLNYKAGMDVYAVEAAAPEVVVGPALNLEDKMSWTMQPLFCDQRKNSHTNQREEEGRWSQVNSSRHR